MPKTAERPKTESNDVPEGYTPVGRGNLPPFFDLRVGGSLYGILQAVRVETKTEKVKVKGGKTEEVEKRKYYFDVNLTKEAVGEDASKQHNDVEHQPGTRITLSGSGALVRAFMDAALKAEGKGADDWPEDGSEPKINWQAITGLEVFVMRQPDGKMSKKSAYPGNKVKQYAVGVKFNKQS